MADDVVTPGEALGEPMQGAGTERDDTTHAAPDGSPSQGERWALVAGLFGVVMLAALVGWLGFRAQEAHTTQAQRSLFVQVARQGAVDLSTVDYEHADADAQRILDLATGTFYDNFSRRSRPFVLCRQRQAGTAEISGTVTEAGLESQNGNEGQVLVAVTVKSTDPSAAEQGPQKWRMRITVKKIGDKGKVSNVAFVS
jgi:Mce-associated membrane protein